MLARASGAPSRPALQAISPHLARRPMSTGRQSPPAWRAAVLGEVIWREDIAGPPVNRLRWPGYEDRTALRIGRGAVAGHEVVVAVWDFRIFGGSFGERDATAFLTA